MADIVRLNSNENTVFFTLTFATKVYDSKVATSIFRKFKQNFLPWKKSGYLYVFEEHEKGGLHIHGFMFDSLPVHENYLTDKWGGWCKCSRLLSVEKSVKYIVSYIKPTKLHRRVFYCSKNLKMYDCVEDAKNIFGDLVRIYVKPLDKEKYIN